MQDIIAARRAAVRHILAAPGIETRARRHTTGAGVDWPALLAEAETMSGGERLLVSVAHDLWAAGGTVPLQDVAERLGPASFERVVDALRIWRGDGPTTTVLEDAA